MDKIITISRQYGSGGREIGRQIAEHFNIPFYDNELITLAAKESGYAEAAFHNAETKATNSLLYSIAMGMSTYGSQESGFAHLSLDDRIYLAQSDIIRKVANEGPCVIVGRCADYILKEREDVIHLFVHANLEFRKARAIKIDGIAPENAEEIVLKKDKRRANYYNYHSGEKWGKASNYHMSVNSGYVGVDKAAKAFIAFLENI
ncbi:MAG: cytidylate kinase-like family protein [Lachnospiraceae bacterium]|nr:cytidylate kinase-like family protein [Lachnospiraceae bacterium]